MKRYTLYRLGMAPWPDFPAVFSAPQNHQLFGPTSILGQPIRQAFGVPFVRPVTEPGSTRDLILRRAVCQGGPGTGARTGILAADAAPGCLEAIVDLNKDLKSWADQAVAAYAEMERQKGSADEALAKEKVAALWQGEKAGPIVVLLQGSAAEGRGAEVTFQLGLCKHEEAARLQARKALAARGGVEVPEDAKKTADAWPDAENFWKEYSETLSQAVTRRGKAARQLAREAKRS